jgi:integrase
MPGPRTAAVALDIERAVPQAVWKALLAWLDRRAAEDAYWRTVRAAVLLLHDSGMRVFEAAGAERSALRPAVGEDGQLWGELQVVGKRTKLRLVPISRRAYAALAAHWKDCDAGYEEVGPLLMPTAAAHLPRVRAKAEAGGVGYSVRGLRKLVERAGAAFRTYLEEADPALHTQARHLHPHAFRHAFGTTATEAGVPLDVLQSYLGHASPATTALYYPSDAHRCRREVDKVFADD